MENQLLKSRSSPLQFLEHTSHMLDVPVWVKREDLYHELVGGSKVRKLINIFQSIEAKTTDLITIGTTGSHHVNATAIWGKKLNLQVHGILLPQPDLYYSNRIFESTKLELSNIYLIENFFKAGVLARKLFLKLKKEGRVPYFIFPGGSNLNGVLAYKQAGLELEQDMQKKSLTFDHQICVYGTGGLLSGLYLALQFSNVIPPIHAVQVYPGFWNGKLYIQSIAAMAEKKRCFFKNFNVQVQINQEYIGAGYGTEDERNREAVQLFAKDGIFLDPVYMARAAQALVNLSRRKKNKNGLLLWYSAPRIE